MKRLALILLQTPFLVAPDGTFLGNLSSNPFDPNSVNNPYGIYGNPNSANSIKNPNGIYGSPYSPNSVTNPYAPSGMAPRVVCCR